MTKDSVTLLTAAERYLTVLKSLERCWAIPNGNESIEQCWAVLNTQITNGARFEVPRAVLLTVQALWAVMP
jgi:hypothetical protein